MVAGTGGKNTHKCDGTPEEAGWAAWLAGCCVRDCLGGCQRQTLPAHRRESAPCPLASEKGKVVAVGNKVTEHLNRLLLESSTSQQLTDWIEVGKFKLLNFGVNNSLQTCPLRATRAGAETVGAVRQGAGGVCGSGRDGVNAAQQHRLFCVCVCVSQIYHLTAKQIRLLCF